ncbi:N-acetylmuramoyl-L-alanine amidase [Alicyclobacillus fastidiosus]|uniref:N-acetylmuramoyl-L-alanine amidase n=1 Tax=Alicyclobacillus fastidiosus TaxID=392011 RepID=A0ABV5AIY8_9BACL|nr:N-acetylmuramoyl-L-alanine amidase [Alicyclobacillus fastidiosus]WEH10025.1 N-acetylmuramoyl-L-alanine amidase [Alicyclobacillus fastidiosus]
MKLYSWMRGSLALLAVTAWTGCGPLKDFHSVAHASSLSDTGRTYNAEETSRKSSGLAGKVIVIDAGHGGHDSGARGVDDVHEKEITLAVAKRLTTYLHEAGATVITTRFTDTDLATDEDRRNRRRHMGDLRGRLSIVRNQSIDAFVSIHCNAAPSPNWHGAQVLYLKDNDHAKQLATVMQETFHDTLLPTKRSIQSNETLYLLKRIKGPSVLAEIGFITNPNEASWLQRPAYQEKVALAMYVSLHRYYDEVSSGKVPDSDSDSDADD